MRAFLSIAPLLTLVACAATPVSQPPTASPVVAASPPASTSTAPLPPPARPQPVSVPLLKAVTRTLASDGFEGRAPTTVGEERTVPYLIAQMKKAGLRPGNQGKWVQEVPLVGLRAENVSDLTVTGGKAPLSLAYKQDMIAVSYRVTPQINLADSEMVFVGFGINAPDRGWNDYAGLDVRGKTVVILINDPDYDMQGLDGPFGGRAMTWYGRWVYKFEEAARQGAAAAIIVHDDYPAAYPWDVVVSSWSRQQLELDEPGGHMDQTLVNGWVTLDAARRIFAAAGKDFDSLATAARHPGFRPVPLGLRAGIRFDNRIAHSRSRNVIGLLRGTRARDDYVLYTAHWDHLGHCEPVKGDGICNGAVDNASGVAGMIALAHAHKRAGPAQRSVLFLATTAEEAGLLGSRWFAEHPPYPLGQIVGGINMDGLSMAGRTRDVTVIGAGKSELEDYLARAARAQGRTLVPEATPEKGSFYRSDHFSLAKLGVPMLYAESGEDLLNGGVTAGHAAAADYIANRYHKPADKYDPAWDWSGAVQDLDLYYRVGRELASGTVWPQWYPGAEFRAARAASRPDK